MQKLWFFGFVCLIKISMDKIDKIVTFFVSFHKSTDASTFIKFFEEGF